ncbi:MAG: GLPGLI family protein [Bacteroidia bacterium]|nr:GLPGLI family protein [Bacteroidia bacterium]
MNNVIKMLTLILLLISATATAQEFQGKATYQTKTTLDLDLANSGIPADRIKMIKERMKSRLEKTYELNFNKTASIYKEEATLDQAEAGRGGMRFMMIGGGASGDHYKNIQTKIAAKENEFSGKNFLIKDSLVTYDWKMEQETKMIGEYLCFKATTVDERPLRREMQFGRGRPNMSEEERKEQEEKDKARENTMELITVTAWYTLDIPVSHGPGDYWGLPGLILEISDDNTQILCTKIVMNPKEKAELKEPTKGKVVTQKEYDKIIEEKTNEMRERMRNERQKSGPSRNLRIRG